MEILQSKVREVVVILCLRVQHNYGTVQYTAVQYRTEANMHHDEPEVDGLP
jgi:hypothetical protein